MRQQLTVMVVLALIHASTGAAAPSDGSDDGSVNVTIDDYCEVEINDLTTPGFLGILGLGQSGVTEYEIENEGSLLMNASVTINFTQEPDPWTPGTPIGTPLNRETTESFQNIPTWVQANSSGDASDTPKRDGFASVSSDSQGWHTARIYVNAACNPTDTDFFYTNFRVLDLTGDQGGSTPGPVETNETAPADVNQTSGTIPAESNRTQGTNPAESNATQGSQPRDSNQTQGSQNATSNSTVGNIPENVNATDGNITRDTNQTEGNTPANVNNTEGNTDADVNEQDGALNRNDERDGDTFPQDAEQVGEESDITEGDDNNPGQTPEPQPEPTPLLAVNMQPLNETYRTARGQFADIGMEITSDANETLRDLEIRARLDQLEGNWTARSATIANISPSGSVNRSVFVQPGEDVEPGYYAFPVVTRASDGRPIAAEYVDMYVRQEVFASQMEIAEAPSQVTVRQNGTTTIPVLIRNTGRSRLENVSAELQNVDGLDSVQATSIERMEINGTAGLRLRFNSSQRGAIGESNATLVVASSDGAYSFANIRFQDEQPDDGVVPEKFRVPIVATAWTILLVLYALLTKFYDLDSALVRLPFIALILGEVTLLLYVGAEYYGLSSALLPF